MLSLRGHHLICLNFFHGEGYDEVFVKNLEEILSKVKKEYIKVIEGVDDVCRSCPIFTYPNLIFLKAKT